MVLILSSLGNEGSKFWLQTNKEASREKIVTIDISSDNPMFEDVVPEDPDALIMQAALVSDHLVLVYSRNVRSFMPVKLVR
jgi:prolyl oligopeptidase